MDITQWIFLPGIFLLGIITSYQDIKYGKIKNKWIVLSMIYAVLAYLILFYVKGNVNKEYFFMFFINFGISILVGYFLWFFSFWTAGDGKLFIAYCFLIPLSFYSNAFFNYFPSIILIFNTFIVGVIFMIIMIISKVRSYKISKLSKNFFLEVFSIKRIIISAGYIFVIFWIINLFLIFIKIDNSDLISYFFIIIISVLIKLKFYKVIPLIILITLSLVRFKVDSSIYSLNFLLSFIISIVILQLINAFFSIFSNLSEELFTKEKNIEELKEGDILNSIIIKKGRLKQKELDELKKNNKQLYLYNGETYFLEQKDYFIFNKAIKEEAEGLTKEQIELIKKIGIKKIKVSQTIPFAPIMFLGVLITIISKGNLFVFIK